MAFFQKHLFFDIIKTIETSSGLKHPKFQNFCYVAVSVVKVPIPTVHVVVIKSPGVGTGGFPQSTPNKTITRH